MLTATPNDLNSPSPLILKAKKRMDHCQVVQLIPTCKTRHTNVLTNRQNLLRNERRGKFFMYMLKFV